MRRVRFPIAVLVVAAGAAVGVMVSQPGPPDTSTTNLTTPTTRELAGGTALRGLAIELYNPNPRYRYEKELRELAEMGTQVVCLSVRGWQEDVNSSRIFIDHESMPTEEALVAVMKRARNLGMQVILLPIVLLWDPSGEDWRGVIAPRNWDRWWESYRRFILYFARLAEEAGAEMLSVGSELISTEHMRWRWQEVIRAVRQVYHGKLLYSANWDHYKEVSFWDDLDLVGMTAYHTLAESRNPTADELRRHWAPIKREILDWQREVGKRIVFTEVGYPSQDGCAREPWNYYGSQRYDWREQYLCLRVFFETWRDEPAVAAIIVWKWEDPTGPEDLNYTPKRKPTEVLIRSWLMGGAGRLPPTPSLPTAPSQPARRKRSDYPPLPRTSPSDP